MQADRLKDLGATVALYGGDTHLGHGLDHAFDGSLDEVFNRLLVINTGQHLLLDHVIQRFKGKIGVDGGTAVAQQHGKVVHFTRFTGLQHQRNPGTGLGADQVVVQAGNGQQGRNGGKFVVYPTVGQDQNCRAGLNEANRSAEQAFKSLFHPLGAIGSLEQ